MNFTFFKLQLLRYWLAMNAAAIQSAAHSGRAWLAVAGVHALNESVPALNLKQFLAVLGLAFLLAALSYLDAHPLPALAPTVPVPMPGGAPVLPTEKL